MQQNLTYQIVRQTADQNMTQSSTTLQAITALVAALVASGVYKYRLTLLVKGFADSSIKVAMVGPTSPTIHAYGLSSVTPKSTADSTGIAVTLVDNTESVIVVEGIIQVGTTAGNLQAECAQNVSEADQLVVQKGSCLEVWRIDNTTS